MVALLGAEKVLPPDETFSLAGYAIGATIALAFMTWIVLKLRSLFCEDEEDSGRNSEFLGLLSESEAEGDVTREEFRSIQRRWLEQQMGVGDSSRATPAKTAGPHPPTPPLKTRDNETEEPSP